MFLSIAIFASFFKSIANVGVITADVSLPITNTIANAGEYADYNFRFNLSTKLYQGGFIEVTFPNQYDSGLGIPLLPSCDVDCDRFERAVSFYFPFDLFPGVVYNVSIKNVKNPDTIGGTGQFIIRSKRGANTLDETKIHGILGIGGSIGTLTSTTIAVDSSSASSAGDVTKYIVSFKTLDFLPNNIYVKLYLPKGAFEVSPKPSCSAFEINGNLIPGNFSCSYNAPSDSIEIRGFSKALEPGTEAGISISMRNPTYSYTTDVFNIIIYKEGTSLAYTRKLDIKGVPITSGKITQISIQPMDSFLILSRGKQLWYRLAFKLTNPLPTGSIIEIKIPDTIGLTEWYILGKPTSFYVETGLEDISYVNPLSIYTITISGSKYIRIENFKEQLKPEKIVIAMVITLPLNNGLSLPFEIRSYLDSTRTYEIDKDVSTARIDVSTINKPPSFALSVSNTVADGTTYSDFIFDITPDKTIESYGSFKLLLDERFVSTGVDNSNCRVWVKNLAKFIDSPSCTKRDRDIYLKLDNQPYSLGITSQFQLLGVIRNPSLSGQYYVEVQSLSPSGELLESYTHFISYSYTPLSGISGGLFPIYKDEKSLHDFSFVTPYEIPAAKVQQTTSDLTSFIRLVYAPPVATPTNVASDLGMGLTGPVAIPCKGIRGLNAIDGYNVNCTFSNGDSTNGYSPYIDITNFQLIKAGSNIQIYIPNIQNPHDAWTLNLYIISVQTRVRQLISGGSLTFSLTLSLPVGLVSDDSSADPDLTYSINSKKVSTDFDYNHKTIWVGTINANSRILYTFPSYDTGFVPDEGHTVCKIGAITFNCYQFPGIDWVYGQTFEAISVIKVPSPSYFYMYNIHWPRIVPDPLEVQGKALTISIIDESTQQYNKILKYARFPIAEPNEFISTKLNVDKKRRTEVDSTYTFTFVPKNNIPSGGTVVLTLPTQYNLIASYPRVEIKYPEFLNESSTSGVSHVYTANIITINNMKLHPGGVPFRVIIKGLRNPDIAIPLTGFSVKSLFEGRIINESQNFLEISLDTLFSSGVILLNSIDVFPTNNLIYAEYTFSFTPQTKLSVGSEIHIKFPSDFITLPQSPDCSISDGLQTFESCESLADEIVVTLDTAYITGKILIKIKGIQNPNIESTESFEIYTFYDGSIVDTTEPETAAQRIVTLSPVASLISMKEFYFDPINEGEISNYIISFIPTNNIISGMNIHIRFPESFDSRLGNNVEIYIINGLIGDIQTSIKDKIVIISNFDQYSVSAVNPVKIQITGVINPNKPSIGHSGYISVGSIYPGNNRYEDFLEQAAVVETSAAAGWLSLNLAKISNFNSRSSANYTFNITVTEPVPKTEYQGMIYADYPSNYEVATGIKKCTNLTSNLGENIKCKLDKRTLSLSGHTEVLTSDISFTVFDIFNPLDEITTATLFMRTYDGFKREIIQRSFENLDPFMFNFFYPGPLIIVNEDKPIYVERGTQSKDVYLVSEEIMALNLSIYPSTPGFTLVPSPLRISIGEKQVRFRVSVSMGFPDGEYYITWIIKGEQDPPLYTPIKKTRVIITKKGNIPIQLSDINDITLGGNSLPVLFLTDYSPDIGIEVLVTLKSNYPGLALNTPSVIFNSGDNLNSFVVQFTRSDITASETVQSGEVLLELIGVNRDIFNLPKNSLKFNVILKDTRTPDITDIQLKEVTQTGAKVAFSCSDISTAYYIIALKGTKAPTLDEIKTFGPPEYETTETMYGIYYVGKELSGIISFSGLTAETDYAVYVFLQDRGNNIIEAPGYLEFKTLNRHDAAFFNLRFRQTYVNSAERALIAERVAFLLSLLPYKVEEKKFNFGTAEENARLLQEAAVDEVTSLVSFTILADPLSSIYPAPIDLALMLNSDSKKAKMAQTFSNYDTSFVVSPYNFTRYEIGFSSDPVILNVTNENVTLQCNLDSYGWIYAVAVRKADDLGKPSPFQISRGIDYRNVPLPSAVKEVNIKFILYEMDIPDLDPDTDYNLYVTAGSAHPGYPDLMSEKKTVFLEFKTNKAPIIPKLSLETGFIFDVSLGIILGALIVIY